MIEVWKPIQNGYQISNRGRVRNRHGKQMAIFNKGKYIICKIDKTYLHIGKLVRINFPILLFPKKSNIVNGAIEILRYCDRQTWHQFTDVPDYYFESLFYFIEKDQKIILNEDSTAFKVRN